MTTTEAALATVPRIGESFGPITVTLTEAAVRDYANATGDEGFWSHQLRLARETGTRIAPPTILDRDVGTRLASLKYPTDYGLHAKQSFDFLRPLVVGETYRIAGALTNVYERNEIKYFTLTGSVHDTAGTLVLSSEYTRAFELPGGRHPGKVSEPLTLVSFLERSSTDAWFPQVGSAMHGTPTRISQDLMNLYSGPRATFHTNRSLAAARGYGAPIAQGLMAQAAESTLLRDVFGSRWYTTGHIESRFIRTIAAESIVTAWAVVTAYTPEAVTLRSAAFDQDGRALTLSNVTVSL